MNSDSEWVIDANLKNNNKNMNSYSTTGALENIMKQNSNPSIMTDNNNNNNEKHSDTTTTTGNVTYTQTNDDIEIRITLSINTKKSDFNLIIKTKTIQLINKSSSNNSNNNSNIFFIESTNNDLDTQITGAKGLELWSGVDTSSSTWTLEKYKNDYNILIISLNKIKEGLKWPSLNKE